MSIYEHNSEGDGYVDTYGLDPPLNHYPFKGQEAYTIQNVSVFVNTIEKEMDWEIDVEMDME